MRLIRKLKGCRQGLLASLAVAALCLGTVPSALAGSRESFSKWLRCPSIDQRGQLSHRDGRDAPCKFVVDHRSRKVVALVRGKVNNHSKRPQIHKNCGLVPPSVYGGCNWTRELYSVSPNGICSGIAYGQMKPGSRNKGNDRDERVSKKGDKRGKGKQNGEGSGYGNGKSKGKDKGRHYGKDDRKGNDRGRDYDNDRGRGKNKGRNYDKGRDHGKEKGRGYDKDRGHGKDKGGDRGGKGRGGRGGKGNDNTEVT
jgi:hypothetical protein